MKDKERTSNFIIRLFKLVNLTLLTLVFFKIWNAEYSKTIASVFYIKGELLMAGLFAFLYLNLNRTYDGYRLSISRISELFYSQALAIGIADTSMYVVTFLLNKGFPALQPFLTILLLQVLISLLWCIAAKRWYYSTHPPKGSLLIYDHPTNIDKYLQAGSESRAFYIDRKIKAGEYLKDPSVLDGIEAVFMAGVPSHERNIILKRCVDEDVPVYLVPRVGDMLMYSSKEVHMLHLPIMAVHGYAPTWEYLVIKRIFDIVASLMGLIVLSPVFLATAIAIKSYDGGPVFYKQTRLTQNGRLFEVLKFRSMIVDAEKHSGARLSSGEKDDRITPPGRVIRKFRIDELPQLINILRGDMSVVGPRPERPEIAAEYEKTLPAFRLRLKAKAGLTGYAQVYGKYNTTPYDKLQMDLLYQAHPSIVQDLRIIFATVKILFMPESTEGIEEGQTNAMEADDDE
ncbi:MAG: sugar transferase [Firmicutes bacterium]|nr:sugar transferase [Bacillota bacterium]